MQRLFGRLFLLDPRRAQSADAIFSPAAIRWQLQHPEDVTIYRFGEEHLRQLVLAAGIDPQLRHHFIGHLQQLRPGYALLVRLDLVLNPFEVFATSIVRAAAPQHGPGARFLQRRSGSGVRDERVQRR